MEELFNRGTFQEALYQIHKIELKHDLLSEFEQYQCNLFKAKILSRQGQPDKALELVTHVEKSLKKLDSLQRIDLLLVKSYAHWLQGTYNECKKLLPRIKQEIHESKLTNINKTKKEAERLIQKGYLNWSLGDINEAIVVFNESLEISKSIKYNELIAESLGNIGVIYMLQGALRKALKVSTESLQLFKDLNNAIGIAEINTNIGSIYWRRGELDKALEYYEVAFSHFNRLKDSSRAGAAQANIGKIYYHKNELSKALETLQEAKSLYQSMNNNLYLSSCLFYLILVAQSTKRHDLAQEYLNEIELITKGSENKLVIQYYKTAHALLLKETKRFQNIARAENLLREVSREPVIDSYVNSLALVNLGEILLLELRSTGGNPEIVEEIQHIVNQLLELANKENLYILLIQVYLVQSKLALIHLNRNFARKLLNKAQQISEEKGLANIAILVSNEYDQFLTTISNFEEYRESSVIKRVESLSLDEALLNLKHIPKEPKDVDEETPVLLLIMHENGLCVYSKEFNSHQFKEQLISGVLVAINSLMRDAFALTKGSIERIKYKDYILVFKEVSPLLFCYVFRGSSYYPLHKLEHFINSVRKSKEHWKILVNIPEDGLLLSSSEQQTVEKFIRDSFLSEM